MMNSNMENQTLILSDTNLILNNSTESEDSNVDKDLAEYQYTESFSKMKTSRTESEISNKLNKSHRTHSQNRHSRKNHPSALTNNLSHYYSLTDVKYYNIDDNEDENVLSTTSSISSSSLSSSASFTSSARSNSEQSFDEDTLYLRRHTPKLQKSLTLPSFADLPKSSQSSGTKLAAGEATTASENADKCAGKPIKSLDTPVLIPTSLAAMNKSINKSLSDYCMSSLSRTRVNQQQLKRRRRFLNGNHQQNESAHQNGNEADDEEKFDEIPQPKNGDRDSNYPSLGGELKESALVEAVKSLEDRTVVTPVLDEMASTLNSEVSWDGYTESPYYSSSVVVAAATAADDGELSDKADSKKIQPILPWDELFFELEPLDELSQNNAPNNKKLRSRRSTHNLNGSVQTKQITRLEQTVQGVQHHFHYYHHHHHHYTSPDNPQQPQPNRIPNSRAISHDLNKLTESNLKARRRSHSQESSTSSENTSSTSGRFSYLSSSNSPNDITSTFENDFALLTVNRDSNYPSLTVNTTSYDQCITNIKEKFLDGRAGLLQRVDMEDLVHVINDSLCQWGSAYNLFIRLKSVRVEATSTAVHATDVSTRYKSSLLTSSCQYETSCSIANRLAKYNEILAACQTNISCLASIKNSLIENRQSELKRRNNSNSEQLVDLTDIKSFDYYLPKLDETIIKWKMLESIVSEDNRYCSNLQNFTSNLKSIRNRMEIISSIFKQLSSFDSLDELAKKLHELEENRTVLVSLDKELAEKRQFYDQIINKENSCAENDGDNLNDMSAELSQLQDLLESTMQLVEVKLKCLQRIQESWLTTERVASQLKSEFERHCVNLNPGKSTMLICFDLFGTDIHQRTSVIGESDLELITNEVEHFKSRLGTLKYELADASLFMHNSFYNSYCLLLDRFWSNIRILREILNSNKEQTEQPGYNQMDLLLNDSVLDHTDMNLQFDPRIDQLSTPRNPNELAKICVSDKQVATVDEKSSQTELLLSSVNETSSSNVKELSSPSLIDNGNKKTSQRLLDSGIQLERTELVKLEKLEPLLIDHEPILVHVNLKQPEPKEQIELEHSLQKQRKAYIHKRCQKQHIECLTELVPIKSNRPVVTESIHSETTATSQVATRWCSRLLKFLLLLLLALLVVVVFVAAGLAAFISPSCCDFKREFLIFNTKVYNDGPLPH